MHCYEPVGYYATDGDGMEPLCPDCAAADARLNEGSLEDSEPYVPIFACEEYDYLEYCVECGEMLDVTLTGDGLANLEREALDALKDGDPDTAQEYARILSDHGITLEAYGWAVTNIGYPPVLEPPYYLTYHEAATAMLNAYEGYPPELIDSVNVERDEDGTILEASIDLLGGVYASVEEVDI